ncbi:hypothetical protein NGA_0078700 [Nannochloropsis gaditana CCMP526]|uniref:Uncharacterized protein n=1 Tax=Nannochloropsis gaditana TaxID=72520 RepID=W7TKY8_9STRA|nr:hypothetical protein NGA_0078700 [Nannochloropsis gaditana CCMP526]EKU21102.1 hypothetical protein NGA_0078700 [Nannochloropsis gaditana CCMP526]EWM24143.1 hypothetical protein Naga_100306g2 [Nannochloropsis gaditana]|eukprot:XP_005855258.1 hypothetical protein NGA_0078700 [Nannochloropsis gaditana CCMP526]
MASHFLATVSHSESSLTLCALLLLTIICATLFVLRICFGTFSLSRVLAHFEERRHLERAYALAYQRREDSIYHRDWAKSRGAFSEAKRLDAEIEETESELDSLDDTLGNPQGILTKRQ